MNWKTPVITLAIAMLISFSSYAQNGPPAGKGPGSGGGTITIIGGELTDENIISGLVWVREEEKLARDTYITLFGKWDAKIFDNISRAEQQHMDSMLLILDAYGITDPVTSNEIGAFSDKILDDLYDQLISDGSGSLLDALHVGAFIEELDISDIRIALEDITQTDIRQVYESLLAGSYNHLRSFVGQIESLGVDYQPQYLSQAEVDEILGQSGMTAQMSDGSWVVTGNDGEGMIIDVTIQGRLVLFWLTYDKEGNQMWILGLTDDTSGPEVHMTMSRYSGPAFGPMFNSDDLEAELWGDVTIKFLDCGNAMVHYDSVSGFGSGELEIQRIYYASGSLCQPE